MRLFAFIKIHTRFHSCKICLMGQLRLAVHWMLMTVDEEVKKSRNPTFNLLPPTKSVKCFWDWNHEEKKIVTKKEKKIYIELELEQTLLKLVSLWMQWFGKGFFVSLVNVFPLWFLSIRKSTMVKSFHKLNLVWNFER